MKEIQKALELYRLDNSKYPTTQQGLKALVEKPTDDPIPRKWKQYMDDVPKDPWGGDYVYISPGVKGAFDIVSLGPDNKESEDDVRHSTMGESPSPGQ
jgi:general secretion pathway protein G